MYENSSTSDIVNNKNQQIPFYTPLAEKRKDIDHSWMIYSIKVLFELMHVHVTNIPCFPKMAIDSNYSLLAVNVFTSKIYMYPMKKKESFSYKINFFLPRYLTKNKINCSRWKDETSNRLSVTTKENRKAQWKI